MICLVHLTPRWAGDLKLYILELNFLNLLWNSQENKSLMTGNPILQH